MRSGIAERFDLVVTTSDHDATLDDHTPHRHLVGRVGCASFAKCGAHTLLVVAEDGRHVCYFVPLAVSGDGTPVGVAEEGSPAGAGVDGVVTAEAALSAGN